MLEKALVEQYASKLSQMKEVIAQRVSAISADKSRASGPIHPDFEEQAVDLQNNEVLDGIEDIDRNELNLISKALNKIQAGSFGDCEQCGEVISQKRLDAVPYAEKCIKCSS